ncbi:MAG: ABC transporter ATP-binding protein [Patescibacteria group bacterium]|nr:ABC transporter ATP-binding protein [Patescibacteria group bacterium]
MANPVLEFKNVSKTFGSLTAIKDLSFVVRPGEIYGLIGPNGSGKTTTLKMIAGLYRPTEGSVLVQGYDVVEASTKSKEHIGYVSDEPNAYDRLTGREFLQFVGELFGMDRTLRDARIEELLGEFGIHDLAGALFGGYSRGTKQKMSIIAAFLHEPELILIDEPMVGLDPASARTVKKMLSDYAKDGGAVLLSTHTLPIADEICDKYGVLKEGVLDVEGTKKQLLRRAKLEGGSLEDIYMALTATV